MKAEETEPESKFGDPRKFDPSFKGPIHNRSCTDVLCCILFILALMGYFAVGILAWSQGDPKKVIYPTDSRGQFCGQQFTSLEKKPLLFYFNILKCASPLVLLELQCPTTQICVEKCPDRFLTLVKAKLNTQNWQYYSQFCKQDVDLTKSAPELLRDKACPAMIFPSKAFTRRCLPALETKKDGVVVIGNETSFTVGNNTNVNTTDLLEASKKSNIVMEARQVFMRIFEDYTQSWHWILLGLAVAMVLSLLFIVLLRFLAGVMVWVMIIMVLLVIAYGIFHCYMQYVQFQGQPGADVSITDLGLQTDFSVYLQLQQTWLAFMIILCIVEVIIILLLIFLRKRLQIAIALIKEASRAVGHVMSSLFYPLLTFALLALVIAYWAITAVFLSTSNTAVYKVFNNSECEFSRQTCDPQTFNISNISSVCPDAECMFAFYGGETFYHRFLILFQFYNLFLFFWCVNFVVALGNVTLAGAFASYYWAFKKPEDIPAFPVFSSFGRALRYHTGSLAFGSLILAIVQVIRVVLEYLDHKLKGAENRFAKFLLSCLKCCFWCLEKCIRFINRNAYIMVAIYGKNFCTSAKDAFFLLMRNIIRVAVLDKVTDFLLFLGKLLIVGIVGIGSFFFFSGRIKAVEEAAPSLNYYWVPILTVVFGAYVIAHGFFSVYAMCVDTLFLCFCEDLERNDGSTERPYLMSPELHDILSVSKVTAVEERKEGEEEELALQENGEVQLKQQESLKQENEEETPLMQETVLKQEVMLTQEVPLRQEVVLTQEITLTREVPLNQETAGLQVTTQKEEAELMLTQDEVRVKEEKKEERGVELVMPGPQNTVQQNGIHEDDVQEAVESREEEQQEPEEPKPLENGPQESETPLTPQNE
ncbi:choline transporter-like protein 2 isoform X1 [Ictalurus punctatus]|uniref:Choline transporter-like protein 2 n=1 Tax=Ictalurus punctatus TaxID=7998 RepID=W5ULP9_ICTPU|nr:choline transporter-like protein 2 isoform X1 [Ictalurus punctatus]